jgi:hypothetical protein
LLVVDSADVGDASAAEVSLERDQSDEPCSPSRRGAAAADHRIDSDDHAAHGKKRNAAISRCGSAVASAASRALLGDDFEKAGFVTIKATSLAHPAGAAPPPPTTESIRTTTPRMANIEAAESVEG